MADADWIAALRAEADRTSRSAAAKQIGYSPAVVTQILNGKYAGNVERVEQAVRGALMGGMVACPELGQVAGDVCLRHQRNARNFSGANSFRVRMMRACKGCARFKGEN